MGKAQKEKGDERREDGPKEERPLSLLSMPRFSILELLEFEAGREVGCFISF